MRTRSLLALLCVVVLAASCGGGDDAGVSSATSAGSGASTSTVTTPSVGQHETEPPPEGTNAGVEGALRLGDGRVVAADTVSPSGGEVAIEGGPLAGLTIEVPSGAYVTTTPFEVTLTDIASNTYGEAVTPLTPMITVANGGGYAEAPLQVRIPVRIPEGMFALAFYADGDRLEAIPVLEESADHISIVTRHFSSFFVSAIEYALLPDSVGTGYRVQEDNWQFTNYGTYPRPNGICTGMSLSSIWYFLEQKASDGQLWNRWDDDGKQDTPGFWYDDAFALRWATKVHSQMDWSARLRTIAWKARTGYARLQYDAFRYAMYVTGEPQLEEMWDANGGNGHAMVVYAQTPGSLWVADPNYPKDLREIRFDEATGEFGPYSSGTDAQAIASGNEVEYREFILTAKSSIFDWSTIGVLYGQMQAGVVGAGLFPPYQIQVATTLDDGSTLVEQLTSGYLTSLPTLTLGVNPTFDATVYLYKGTSEQAWGLFEANATASFVSMPLVPGANSIGIGIMGGPNSPAPDKWLDFRRLTVYRDDAVTTTTSPPVTAPTTAPTTTWEDCSQYEPGTIAYIRCHLHDGPIGG